MGLTEKQESAVKKTAAVLRTGDTTVRAIVTEYLDQAKPAKRPAKKSTKQVKSK